MNAEAENESPGGPAGWVGLDLGGANLKGADGRGGAFSLPFELWRAPECLPERIEELLRAVAPRGFGGLAVTMTGELADCYSTKAEGVRHITGSVVSAAGGRPVRVATVDDRWLTPEEAIEAPLAVAAANWRPLTRLVAKRLAGHAGLLADAGSTTVDLIPFEGGRVTTSSRTDTDRLAAGELLYTGVRRTPVCAVVRSLPHRGRRCPVAAELFATTADAWLMLGELPESDEALTADGRPLRRGESAARLGRMVCADRAEFNEEDARAIAEAIAAEQTGQVAEALRKGAPEGGDGRIVVSGEGAFLLRRAVRLAGLQCEVLDLTELSGEGSARCGPAHAVALLALEELGPVERGGAAR